MAQRFFIIGAPKCGTTTLYDWLNQTSSVYMSPIKEPHSFSSDIPGDIPMSNYDALFSGVSEDHVAIGEASTWYLRSEVAVPGILKRWPDAKFIVCARNPAEMAWSMHAHHIFKGEEVERDFMKAWSLQPSRECGANIPAMMRNPIKLQYKKACSIGEMLTHLYRVVDANNVHVVFLDDLKSSPLKSYHDVIEHIGARNDAISLGAKNTARKRAYPLLHRVMTQSARLKKTLRIPKFNTGIGKWIQQKNQKDNSDNVIPNDVRSFLIEEFARDIEVLEGLTQRNLSHWKRTTEQ